MGAGEQILERLTALEAKVDKLLNHLGANQTASGGAGGIATVAQISSTHGDPEIRSDIKAWDGPSFKGARASECPADFLDLYADFMDWKADNPKEGKEKFASYDRKTAALCRRWAIEIREGRRAAPPAPTAPRAPPAAEWSSGNAEPPPQPRRILRPPPL